MTDSELHWLSGLLEGEGSFCCPPPSEPGRVRIQLHMTDEDVVKRVADLWGQGYWQTSVAKEHYSPAFRTQLRGKAAEALMLKLHPLMGARRKSQIERALDSVS